MPLRTYDSKQVIVLVGTAIISGFADGTFVNVMRSSDAFTKQSGADGEVSRSKSNDKSGEITITLAQTSPSNAVLQSLAITDEISNDGIVPIAIKDLSGTSTFVSAFGWVRKSADAEYGKDITNREWVLDCVDLDILNGGNPSFE